MAQLHKTIKLWSRPAINHQRQPSNRPFVTPSPNQSRKTSNPNAAGGGPVHDRCVSLRTIHPQTTLNHESEDQTFLLRQAQEALRQSTGVEALSVWEDQQGQIDLLFTDMILPDGITGRELAKQLKARKPRLKVIYTSGYALDLDGTGFILREGLNFLQKPSKAERIIQAVQELLLE